MTEEGVFKELKSIRFQLSRYIIDEERPGLKDLAALADRMNKLVEALQK